jgi:hypothetical protein
MSSATTSQGGLRGAGGTASGGDVNITGGDGGNGRTILGVAIFSNFGGSSPNGGNIVQQNDFVASNAQAGISPGGGGAGSFSSNVSFAGGAGANGMVKITTYF